MEQYPIILGKSRTFGFYCVNATRFEAYTYVIMSCCGQYMTWHVCSIPAIVRFFRYGKYICYSDTFYNCTISYFSVLNMPLNATILLEFFALSSLGESFRSQCAAKNIPLHLGHAIHNKTPSGLFIVDDNEVDLLADLHSKTNLGEGYVPVGR